jgi:hypothetical protein
MKLYQNKATENNLNSTTNNSTTNHLNSKSEFTFQFKDERQKKIDFKKNSVDNQEVKKTNQLKTYNEIANNCSQVKQLKSYQKMADSFLTQQKTTQLKKT